MSLKNLIDKLWPAPHPTTTNTQTQCQQYLSCYRPDFDETLNLGSWEHLKQIQAVTVGRVKFSWKYIFHEN